MTARWVKMEDWLIRNPGVPFTAWMLAGDLGVPPREATHMIQGYLVAQRSPNSTTAHVLYRTGRTSAAVWHSESRNSDVRTLGSQFADDLANRMLVAVEPDLLRMGIVAPRSKALASAVATVLEGAVRVLAASLP